MESLAATADSTLGNSSSDLLTAIENRTNITMLHVNKLKYPFSELPHNFQTSAMCMYINNTS